MRWGALVLLQLGLATSELGAAIVGPTFLGSAPDIAGLGANRIVVQRNLAYIAAGTNGLVILDISTPARPTRVGVLGGGGTAVDVCVRESLAFVAFGATGRDAGSLQIIDVKDPSSPRVLGIRRGDTQSVVATDTNVYIAAGIGGMLALEYSNPAKPTVTGGFDTPRSATSVRVFDNRLYPTDSFAGLYVFDLSDPAKPVRVGNYDSPGYLGDVWVEGDLAFLADGASGLSIVSLLDPSSPTLVGRITSPKFASRVMVLGKFAYVATGSGWYAVDVSDPAQPVVSAIYQLHGGPSDAVALGNRLLVTDLEGGLSEFAENTGQATQAFALFNPMIDPGIGLAMLVSVESGIHVLQSKQDAEAPWATRMTFGSPNPGVRRIVDTTAATRAVGFYRVVRNP